MQELHSQLAVLLQKLSTALKRHALWSSAAPSAQAMASTAPFACDTMPFEHWLQFIFLPRMQALIDAGSPLPRNFALTPMGEETLDRHAAKTVLDVLAAIDTLMSES